MDAYRSRKSSDDKVYCEKTGKIAINVDKERKVKTLYQDKDLDCKILVSDVIDLEMIEWPHLKDKSFLLTFFDYKKEHKSTGVEYLIIFIIEIILTLYFIKKLKKLK